MAANRAIMDRMHAAMAAAAASGDPDIDFVRGMIPHHQAAVEMAEVQLRYGTDAANRELARHIIEEQRREIDAMREWLRERGVASASN